MHLRGAASTTAVIVLSITVTFAYAEGEATSPVLDSGRAWLAVKDSTFGKLDDIYAIAYGGGKFVAGGYNKMAYSSDGITRTEVARTKTTFGSSSIAAVAYDNNKFIAGALTAL